MEVKNLVKADDLVIRRVNRPTVMKMLGVGSRNTIKAWILDGTFPRAIEVTERTHVWRVSEIEAWAAAHERGESKEHMRELVKALVAARGSHA